MLLRVTVLNQKYELITEYNHVVHIKTVSASIFADSPAEIKLMKKGDGYVFTSTNKKMHFVMFKVFLIVM